MTTSLNEIQQLYHKYRLLVFAMLMLLVTALAMAFVNRPLVFPVLALAVAFHLLFLRPCQKRYTTSVTRASLRQTVCRFLGTKEPEEKGGRLLTAQLMEDAGLMPCGDDQSQPLLCWEIHGQKKDMTLTLCDATIPQSFRLTKRGKKRVHFNAGVWIHVDLPGDTGLHYKVIDETAVPTPIRMDYFAQKWSYETGSLGDPELAKRMVLYRPKDTLQQPSPALLEKLSGLVEYTPGYVALGVNGSHMDVFIRGRFLARPVSVSAKPSQALLDFDPLPELSYVLDLAKILVHRCINPEVNSA